LVGCFVGAGAMGTCNGWHERGAGAIRKHRGHPVCGSALAFACKPLHLHCAWRIESYHRQITACCLRVFVGHPVNYDVDTLDDLFADIGDHSLGQHRAGWTVAVFVSRNGRRANRANGTADAGLKPRAASMADRNSLDVVERIARARAKHQNCRLRNHWLKWNHCRRSRSRFSDAQTE